MWVKHSPKGGEDKTPRPVGVGMGGESLRQIYVDRALASKEVARPVKNVMTPTTDLGRDRAQGRLVTAKDATMRVAQHSFMVV